MVRIPHLPVPDFKKMTGEKLKAHVAKALDYQYDDWRIMLFFGGKQVPYYRSLQKAGVRPGDEVGIMLALLGSDTVFAGQGRNRCSWPRTAPTRVSKFLSYFVRFMIDGYNPPPMTSELCLRKDVADRICCFETQRDNGSWRRFSCAFVDAGDTRQNTLKPSDMWRLLGKSEEVYDKSIRHLVFLKQAPPLGVPLRVCWKKDLRKEVINPQLFFRTLRFFVDPGDFERDIRRGEPWTVHQEREAEKNKTPAAPKETGWNRRLHAAQQTKKDEPGMQLAYLQSLIAARNSFKFARLDWRYRS